MLRSLLGVGVLGLLAFAGCAAQSSVDVATSSALTGDAALAGIAAGSREEAGALAYANDRRIRKSDLVAGGASAEFADALLTARGASHWFGASSELESLGGANSGALGVLLREATAAGYVQNDTWNTDFALVRMVVRPGASHPTSADITIETGFDGRTPDQVVEEVSHRLTNELDSTNQHFVRDSIAESQRMVTIAMSNVLATGSPSRAFADARGLSEITVVGTMSSIKPTFLAIKTPGAPTQYFERTGSSYTATTMGYPVIMRGRVRLVPGATNIFYPAWSATVLAAPTSVIDEPHH